MLTCCNSRYPWGTDAKDHNPPLENVHESDVSTVSSSSEHGEQDTQKVDVSCRPNTVTWKNTDGCDESAQDLSLDLYLDPSSNTAFFKLYGHIYLKKSGKRNRQAIYLFICPETVQTVSWKPTVQDTPEPSSHSLCFSLSKPPDFVIPKDCPLESKNKTQDLLHSIHALARVTTFTAHFIDQKTDLRTREQLAAVASAFSERRRNRPLLNKERANLTTLYAGTGGEVFDFNPKPTTETDPPPYIKVALDSNQTNDRKRRRTSDPSSDKPDLVISLLQTINNKLDTMNDRLDKMDNRITQLEEQAASPQRRCRHGTEEMADLWQTIDNRLEDSMLDIRFEVQDQLKDTIREAKQDMQDLSNSAPETIQRLVDESVKDVLGKASLRFNIE